MTSEAPEGSPTPSLAIRIDWLTLTFPSWRREEVLALVSRYVGEGEAVPYGRNHYQSQVLWESGAFLAWTEGLSHSCLSFNGTSCSLVPLSEIREFMRALRRLGGRASRLDLAADDASREIIRMDDVHQAAESANFCHFRLVNALRPKRLVRGVLELAGDSVTFGRRGGDGVQVQFYDKGLESDGAHDVNRLEARFAGDSARVVFDSLCSQFTEEEFWAQVAESIGGAIDFRQRGNHRHLDRMPVLPWWARVREALGGAVRHAVVKVKPPLQRTMEYVRDAWCRTFALAIGVMDEGGHDGEQVLLAMIRREKGRASGWRNGARDLGLDVGSLLGFSSNATHLASGAM